MGINEMETKVVSYEKLKRVLENGIFIAKEMDATSVHILVNDAEKILELLTAQNRIIDDQDVFIDELRNNM